MTQPNQSNPLEGIEEALSIQAESSSRRDPILLEMVAFSDAAASAASIDVGLAVVPTVITLKPRAAQTPLKFAAGKPLEHKSVVEPRPGILLKTVASWRLDDRGVDFRLSWESPPEDSGVAQTEIILLFRSPATRAVLGSPHYAGTIADKTWEAPRAQLGFDPCSEAWELEIVFLPASA